MEFMFDISEISCISDYSSLLVALYVTSLCICFATILVRQRLRRQRIPSKLGNLRPSVCVDGQNGLHGQERTTVLVDVGENGAQVGISLMEQLVPDLRLHALSFLDYPSVCRLSMANSLLHRAANDEILWKRLYLKDFSLEQSNVKPANGWEAYYVANLAIVNINAEFFRIVKERSHTDMSQFWLKAGYVKCFHATGESFAGYNQVMESWRATFNQENAINFQIRDVRTHVLTDMAWVTMKAYSNMERAYNVTNIYELCDGRWYMVHHHSLAALFHGGADQQFV